MVHARCSPGGGLDGLSIAPHDGGRCLAHLHKISRCGSAAERFQAERTRSRVEVQDTRALESIRGFQGAEERFSDSVAGWASPGRRNGETKPSGVASDDSRHLFTLFHGGRASAAPSRLVACL